MQVQEFSLGMPPNILKKKIKGTVYKLGLLPLGGYVKLKGQNIDDENSQEPDNYASKTILEKFLILLGGPLMNILYS